MKLLFMDREDVFNTWGHVRFRAAVLERVAELEPDPAVSPDFTVRCCVRQDDGSYVVYACDGGRDHKPWQIYRYRTDDGIHLQAKERVYQSEPGRWSQTTTLNYSPDKDLFLCLKNMKEDDGGSTFAYLSRDGERWETCPTNPVYVEGDRWGCVWSSAVQRFITYNKGIQRHAGKLTPELLYGGVGLSERWDARRVVTIRTSPDGCRWEPDDPDWSRRGTEEIDGVKRFGGPAVPPEYQITPDDQDPPDLEFYAGYVFEYEGRYFMNMLNYAPSLLPAGSPGVAPGGHGPNIDSEWWISRDGLRWERPFRATNTITDRVAFIQHNPMVVDGQLLFHQRDLGRVTGEGDGAAPGPRRVGHAAGPVDRRDLPVERRVRDHALRHALRPAQAEREDPGRRLPRRRRSVLRHGRVDRRLRPHRPRLRAPPLPAPADAGLAGDQARLAGPYRRGAHRPHRAYTLLPARGRPVRRDRLNPRLRASRYLMAPMRMPLTKNRWMNG